VVFRNTKQHGNADALSRLPVGLPEPEDEEFVSDVHMLASSSLDRLPVTSKRIRHLTARDKVLSAVFRHVTNGWPKSVDKLDPVYPYYVHREELTIVQGVILWGFRVLIPSGLRAQILEEIHSGHSGIVRMKSLARQFVWWPGIDADIKKLSEDCHPCRESSPSPPSAPLHPWEFPERPWQRLHVDLAGPFLNKTWLVVMDAHSKWPEVYSLDSDSTSSSVIRRLRDCFVRFGIPEQIVSDNGRQFTSHEFQEFCTGNGIKHTTSSVYHPRSNGEAERFVKTFKDAMSKGPRHDWELTLTRFLFTYRITPHATTGSAPCELLQGRKLRCLLDLVRPSPVSSVTNSQVRQETSFNKRCKVRKFQVGQKVWVKTFSKNLPLWSLGQIVSQKGPLTFVVSVGEFTYRRHQDHMQPANSDGDEFMDIESPAVTTRAQTPTAEKAPVSETDSSDEESSPPSSPPSSEYDDDVILLQTELPAPRRGKRKRVQRQFFQAS
jgi:transposase InsO family protein